MVAGLRDFAVPPPATSQPRNPATPFFNNPPPPRRITFDVHETLRRVIRHKLMYGGVRATPLALAVHAGRQYGVLTPVNGAAGVSD